MPKTLTRVGVFLISKLMKKTKLLLGAFLALGVAFYACEKESVTETQQTEVVNNGQNRTGEHTIGYYHNEILGEVIATFRVMTPDNEADVYAEIQILSESYFDGDAPSYAELNTYREGYIPNSYLSMDEAELTIEGTLISDMANKLAEEDYITSSELDYYTSFNDEFYATESFDGAESVLDSYIDAINSDVSLTEEESDRLGDAFDIGKHSFSYWRTEAESGASSSWEVFSSIGDERRGGRLIRALLKVGADLCGGAVGGGIGFAIGGPIGAGIGGAAVGGACSAFMFN